MNKRLEKAFGSFFLHFGYSPEFPQNMDFDQDQFAEVLERCVTEDFDYTIEKYGTVPKKREEAQKYPEVFVD